MAYSGWGATLVYAGALFIRSYGLSTAQAGVLVGVAAREGEARAFDAPGLQELHLQGLRPETARALLAAHGDGLSAKVPDRLVGSTRDNPLALLELPGLLSEDQLASREPLADPLPVGPTLQAAFLELARNLPAESQALLLIAAADDTGDPAVVLRGARELRIEAAAFGAAEASGLVRFGESAVTSSASARPFGHLPGGEPARAAGKCTRCSPTSSRATSSRTVAPCTAPPRRRNPMMRSPRSWSARPSAHGDVGVVSNSPISRLFRGPTRRPAGDDCHRSPPPCPVPLRYS